MYFDHFSMLISTIYLFVLDAGIVIAAAESYFKSNQESAIHGLPANNPVKQPWIWPLPQIWQRGNQTIKISENVRFDFRSHSSILSKGVERYRRLIFLKEVHPMIPYNWSTTASSVTSVVSTINIQVGDTSEELSVETDESYCLVIPTTRCGKVTIKAKNCLWRSVRH